MMRTFKKVLVLTSSLFLFPMIIGAQEEGVTLEFDNATSAQEIVKNYVMALQKGDVAAMNDHLADDAMIYGLGGGQDSLNVAQHKEYYTTSTATYTHSVTQDLYLPVKVTNNWNEGEWVLAWGLNTVTNKQTNTKIPIAYHTASMVKDGKIVRLRYYYDVLDIMMAQGYTLTAPSE
jgi:ketosteroid isomerase-like protein